MAFDFNGWSVTPQRTLPRSQLTKQNVHLQTRFRGQSCTDEGLRDYGKRASRSHGAAPSLILLIYRQGYSLPSSQVSQTRTRGRHHLWRLLYAKLRLSISVTNQVSITHQYRCGSRVDYRYRHSIFSPHILIAHAHDLSRKVRNSSLYSISIYNLLYVEMSYQKMNARKSIQDFIYIVNHLMPLWDPN